MSTAAHRYLEATPMRALLGIPTEVLDQFMAIAFQLYKDGRYPQAEIVCRGLLAADHRYWYPYSLYAATLQKMGRFGEAIAQLDQGLRHEPGQPKLLALREAIRKSAGRAQRRTTIAANTAGRALAQQEAA